jgi:dihydrofolate reductase
MLQIENNSLITAIVAVDSKNGIAKDGKIPWKSKTDMKFFREQTTENIIIMGSTTLLSLPNAMPLPNRINIVLTRTPEKYTCYPKYSQLDNIFFWEEETVLEFLAIKKMENKFLIKSEHGQTKNKKIFVIGGKQIYNLLLRFCDSVLVTRIKANYNCDLQLDCLDTIGTEMNCKSCYEDDELQIIQWSRSSLQHCL